jgi:outer membrane lipoprotein-sorting protein
LLLLPLLNGCLVRTRVVRQAKMPSVVMTSTAEALVASVNQRCQAIHSLSATVEFRVTEGGPRKGRERTIIPFNGYIVLRKPESLRVIGLVPVLHTRAFDMASDGKTFTLVIPSKNKVIEGTNTVTTESPNAFENLRPNIFVDSLLMQCIAPDDLVTLTSETKTQIDARTKQLVIQPDYDLTIARRGKAGSNELIPERVIHFDRTNLEPYEEDIYDMNGAIQTQAIYGRPQTFGAQKFPGLITIKRPLEEYQIAISFQKLNANLELPDNQFEIKVPEGYAVLKLQ